MEFHTLPRKDLQALCKKNKIPANITNVAMSDALSALPQVEGLDGILNLREGDVGTPAVQPRTACRTSTQRKALKEPESSKVSTRLNRGARAVEREVEQENKDGNVPVTPAVVLSSRRRAPAVSTRRKKEVIIIDDDDEGGDDMNEVHGKPMDLAKTPAVVLSSRTRTAGRSVRNKNEIPDDALLQKAYSARRSVRLLGKSLSKISLMDPEDMEKTKVDDVCEEMSNVSQNEEGSVETEQAGASLQTESTVVSQNIDEVEVSSVNKVHSQSKSHDSGSEVKSTDAEDVLQAEPEETLEKVNHVEDAQEDPSSNLQDSFETCIDSNVAGSKQPELEESGDSVEFFGSELVTESEEASMKTSDETIEPLTVLVPEDACGDVPDQEDVTGLSVEALEEGSDEINLSIVGLFVDAYEEAPMLTSDKAIDHLTVLVPEYACDDVPDQEDDAGLSVEVYEEASDEIADQSISSALTVGVPDGPMDISLEEQEVEEVLELKPVLTKKGETSGDSEAGNEVSRQSFEDEKESNEVEKVILQLSMLDVAAKKEDQKDTSEKLKAEAQIEESDERAVGEDTDLDIAICSAQSETNEIANEIQTVPSVASGMANPNMMKENLKTIDVQSVSLRALKKLVKKKIEGKLKTDINDAQMQEMETKRTALQALPYNL